MAFAARAHRPAAHRVRAILAACAIVIAAPSVEQAGAAGMVTHAYMADEAVEHIQTPELKRLLELQAQPLLSGASYPDGGYFVQSFPGGDYGEVSHWEGFTDAYAQYIRSKPGCGDLSDPLGPCAPLIGHLMGTAAHGMGDETWDWMFEPLTVDHQENPDHPSAPPDVPPGSLINSIAYAMDMIALVDYFRWTEQGLFLPPPTDLTAVYSSIGRSDITAAGIVAGHGAMEGALAGERTAAPTEAERVREQMPWSAANFYSESGGVRDSAEAIAGYYDSLWAKLTASERPAPRVVAVHPEDGEQGVPTAWQPPRTSPGPHTGGGELRVLTVLSSAVDASTVDASSFQLLDPSGAQVPALEGFPRAGPYGPDGTHSLLFYPATDLEPCTVYTAQATTGLRDRTGLPLAEPVSWEFRTQSADSSATCSVVEPPPGGDPPADQSPPAGDSAPPANDPPTAESPPQAGGAGATGLPDGDLLAPAARCLGRPATIIDLPGPEKLRGTRGADVIVSLGGRDRIRAGAGDDLICAGRGRDLLRGGGGDDILIGGAGDDVLRGRGGNDRLQGGRGSADRCHGGSGRDTTRSCAELFGIP